MLLLLSIEEMFEVTQCKIKESSQQSDRSGKSTLHSHQISSGALYCLFQPIGILSDPRP